ncbi:hypothetical protein ACFQ0X_22110 [Streptomyces rectiviolaceus]|uniref:Uncharacterized protein n=1 Tax=Streptomyces rectiviolaceus TaxID=332591 RepID=A0ABP6M888_9ACTN
MIKDELERVREALADLCEPLHDAFVWAGQRRSEALPELIHAEYKWHGTHTVRALAHHRLRKTNLGVWALSGNHARNGELWLTDSDYSVRVLHALNDKDVPPPGLNRARRAYYHNPPLPTQEKLTGPAYDRLIALWRLDVRTGAASFRVVRPIGKWRFGGTAKTDLDFPLPETAVDMRSLHFEPAVEGLDDVRLPEEEDGK